MLFHFLFKIVTFQTQSLGPEWLHPDEVSQENIWLGTLFLVLWLFSKIVHSKNH